MKEKAAEIIKEELGKKGINVLKIVLFGSRARGDHREDSDWDFFVVVDRDIEPSEKREVQSEVRHKLVLAKIPSDIMIKSVDQVEEEKNDVGVITYYALKYGIGV